MKSLKIFVWLFFFWQLPAQHSGDKFRFVSIMEDLPKVGVYSINQDDYGFVWLGTNGSGLYRYDGLEYKSYRHRFNDSTSLSSSMVFTTYLDSKHRLWVGTEQGLNLYDRNTDLFQRIPNKNFGDGSAISLSIRSIIDDNRGNLFIGTFGRGLFKMDVQSRKAISIKTRHIDLSIPLSVHVLKIDKDGGMYAATNHGILLYNEKENVLEPAVFANHEQLNSGTQTLVIDAKDNLWTGTSSDGLYKISHMDQSGVRHIQKLGISSYPFFALEFIEGGGILCGTENDGLYQLNEQGELIHHYISSNKDEQSLLSNSIWSLFLDRDKRIWLGYYNKGVAIYDEFYDKFKGYESLYNNINSLHAASVASIDQDDSGNLWVGMDGGGIDIINKKTGVYTHINKKDQGVYSGLDGDYILSVFIDSQGNVWAGSWDNGIYFLKKGTHHFVNYTVENTAGGLQSNTVVSIAEDSKGTMWFASFRNGLHSYNPKSRSFTNHNTGDFFEQGIHTLDIWKVLVDSKDQIWLGTTYGLYKVQKLTNGEFKVSSLFNRLAEQYNNVTTANHILSLMESSDGTIWLGTKGAGMAAYRPDTDSLQWYNQLGGFHLENVCSIIESDQNEIWAAGNSGIVRLDPKTGETSNFDQSDGLLSNDYNMNAVFNDGEGNLYFGGYEGMDFFNPKTIKYNQQETLLYLSDLKIFNNKVLPSQPNSPLTKVIAQTDSITFTSKQSVFTIEYSGINYTRPEKNEYAYYLAGYEDNWNYVGNVRSATYTNLDPGNYIFRLKSSNNDGTWNKEPLELYIEVLPPWWKSNWALACYLLLFFSAILILNKMTQNRIRNKQREKYEEEKRIQQEQLNEKKFQFFTNISHEFRTPLTLIMNPIQDILQNDDLNLPPRLREKHAIIHKNTQRLHRLVNELLDFRKLELNKVHLKVTEFDIAQLVLQIVGHYKEEALNRNIDLSFDKDDEQLMIWGDENLLEKVIFNVISNAFKASFEGGAINVAVYAKDQMVAFPLVDENFKAPAIEVVVTDTGIGLEKEQMTHMFDRFYQVENQNHSYYGGTGIGLEVVQSFVQLHKGKIEVESEPGKGTSFKIILPDGKDHFLEEEFAVDTSKKLEVLQSDTLEDPMAEYQEVEERQENEQISPHTLLLVEDNIELRSYLQQAFKNQYKVLVASNGEQGLKITKDILPDVIITDVIMPKMNGFEFCREIKTDMRTSHIPVLMLTAKAKIEDRIEGIEIGADAYMVKPFDIRLIKLRLSQLISSRQLIFNKYFSAISEVDENSNTTSLDKEFIQKALDYISKNMDDPNIGVESLASHLNLSRSQVYRKIKALTNQTANEFIRNIRLHKAKALLSAGNTTISEVSYAVGFSSSSYFTKCFKAQFGIVPTQLLEETVEDEGASDSNCSP
ncbi:hybrid sensor histidine kinase/response regulator transcription factor [Galbibacter sp.]|uniref:hybrid sensor histidine kinase/response regulator transcription factor n=1 Tax=Galbibacter sp. TaxID=2918471 RepID=UPI002C941A6D|nr:two-component regulator propeller domain-containing protein [Galbibacter sp.]HLV62067.1 two-component regulator propeller domain-containing protein [Galbibacter sp.]